jgi:general secretion pathway protein A
VARSNIASIMKKSTGGLTLMYKAFFNLRFDPFIEAKHITKPFESNALLQLKSRLEFVKKTKGFILITGYPGCGKTFFIHRFKKSLDQNSFLFSYLPLATTNNLQFYRQLSMALDIQPLFRKIDMFHQIQLKLEDLYKIKKITSILVLDDAHMIQNDILQEIPLIFNFSNQNIQPFILILLAHPFLKDKLKMAAFEPLRTRISYCFDLPALSLEESSLYIQSTLANVSESSSLFSEQICKAIHEISKGCIRIINLICHHALISAFSKQQSSIQMEDIEAAASEIILD